MAAFLASAAAMFAGHPAQKTESAQAATEASVLDPNEYLIDTLFRSAGTMTDINAISMRAEADRIFAHALKDGSMSQADNIYLARLISARTGLNQADAQQRVNEAFVQAQEAAEAAAHTADLCRAREDAPGRKRGAQSRRVPRALTVWEDRIS
jgi:hypothetical protein